MGNGSGRGHPPDPLRRGNMREGAARAAHEARPAIEREPRARAAGREFAVRVLRTRGLLRMRCGRGIVGGGGSGNGARSDGRFMNTSRSGTGLRCRGGNTKFFTSSQCGMASPWARRSSRCRGWHMPYMTFLRFMGGNCWPSSRTRCWSETRARRHSSGTGTRRRRWRAWIGWSARESFYGGMMFMRVLGSSRRF